MIISINTDVNIGSNMQVHLLVLMILSFDSPGGPFKFGNKILLPRPNSPGVITRGDLYTMVKYLCIHFLFIHIYI